MTRDTSVFQVLATYRAEFFICAFYFVVFGSLLVKTGSLPYVMDNNETFSSLWHAANLLNYGVSQSWGLADEAFSPQPDAHPYVHTHQGNLPRWFALLIYVPGARSAESQIVITTFTIGLAAILITYRFFSKLATPAFAAIVVLIFMSDYLLFAQWHVVTYRVWHSFLLFSCLLSAHAATEVDSHRSRVLVAIVFAGIFYFELVFAAFVSVLCGLYVISRTLSARDRLWRILFAQGLGAALGLSIVIVQVVGYLGVEGFVRDIYLTFIARNDYSDSLDFLKDASAFYESRHVIFWHNIQERAKFSSLIAFVRSFTSFDWRIHTPLLSVVVWILCAGWAVSILPRSGNLAPKVSRIKIAAAYVILFLGVLLFAANPSFSEGAPQMTIAAIGAGSVTLLAILIASELRREESTVASRWVTQVLMAIGVIFGAVGASLLWHGSLFDESYRPMWEELQGRAGPTSAASLVLIGAVVVFAYVSTVGARRVLGESAHERLLPVLVYLSCGAAAYATVYVLSPGYVYSGYAVRHAPFTVFLTDVMVATAIFVAIKAAIHAMQDLRARGAGVGRSPFLAYSRGSMAIAAVGLPVFLTIYWVMLQVSYVQWLPPTHYAFLKSLAKPPYLGASFVVDNYAAPVAAYTDQWAYFDPRVSTGRFFLGDEGARLAGDRSYLWFADRDTNAEYRRPQYFLCMAPQTPSSVLAKILQSKGQGAGHAGCSTRPLVRIAKEGILGAAVHFVSSDQVGPEQIGFDSWAIVRLQPKGSGGATTLEWGLMPEASGKAGATR